MQMVRAVAALGFGDLYATPHQRSGMFMPAREAIATAFAAVSADVAANGPGVRLGLGAENFWDDVLHGRLRDRTVPVYGEGPAFLFEVHPRFMPVGLENELFQLIQYAPSTDKVELLHESFPSQKARDWWDDEVFLGLARLRGMECRSRYAEAFDCSKASLKIAP